MSWENELKEEITFYSPDNHEFTALWRSNERSKEKKLGIYSPPSFQGDIVQDLGVKSTIYPLTVYFDGIFHHRDADDFFRAFEEKGQWEVVHPVRGSLVLQPISVKEVMDPVNNGSYTEFETQWIEPANIERLVSPTNTLLELLNTILNVADDMGTLLSQLRADVYSAINSASNALNKISGSLDNFSEELRNTSVIARDAFDSAKDAYDNAIANFGVDNSDTDDISAALILMALAPVDANADYESRKNIYSNLIETISELIPKTTTIDDYNKVICHEHGITLALMAAAKIVGTSEYKSRTEVVATMNSITDFFNTAITNIDALQYLFYDLAITDQFYAQTQTYTTLINLYTLVFQYLIQQFYNLKTEKRFVLKKARVPFEITVTEYGSLGDNDENYDLFLNSNNLSGNDILILPAGREVIIYV